MAWQKKVTNGEADFINAILQMHVIPLHDPDTGAEHKLQVMLVHDSCPLCGHCTPKTNLGEIDTPKLIAQEIASLNQSHGNIRTYAKKNRAPIRKANK